MRNKPGKRATEQQKIDALVIYIASGTFAEAERQTGWDRQTISNWKNEDARRYQDLIETYKSQLTQHASGRIIGLIMKQLEVEERLAERMLETTDSVSEDKLHESFNKTAYSLSKMLSMHQLIENQPTSIVQHQSVAELQKELQKILDIDAVEITTDE